MDNLNFRIEATGKNGDAKVAERDKMKIAGRKEEMQTLIANQYIIHPVMNLNQQGDKEKNNRDV